MVRSTNAKLGALEKDIASIQGKTVTETESRPVILSPGLHYWRPG